jgi:hypothetical protein
MGRPPYDDPDTLDLMRADADCVEVTATPDVPKLPTDRSDVSLGAGFEVPLDAVALGDRHFHLD